MDIEHNKIESLRKHYPNGTKICLDVMDGETQMPSGLRGEVFSVDDMGQIHVQWENGSTLALLPGVDRFHKEDTSKKKNREVPSR